MEFTTEPFVCFIRAAEYGAAKLFSLAFLWLLNEDGRLRANEEMLVPLQCKMKPNILKCGLLRNNSDRAIDLVAVILASAGANKIDWSEIKCLGWFLYSFAEVTIASVPK